ncbi:type I glyceraldehyde-3-phosphate dehydrogenase [Endothiovibrio diazotrophicus]
MIKVGINGFGRIGRAVFRINAGREKFQVVAVNDIDPNVENHAYLLKYDSQYGRFPHAVRGDNDALRMDWGEGEVRFFAHEDIAQVPWESLGVDVVIDSSGVNRNVPSARRMVEQGRVGKVVFTHAQRDADRTVVFGVNEGSYDPARDHLVSSSICDVISSAVVLNALEGAMGVEHGFITTLHPWLSYQNLLDGTVRSISNPGHFWDDFSLGRASPTNLIPKQTTLTKALGDVLPELAARLEAMSFRIPTGSVTVSDMVLELGRESREEELDELFSGLVARNPGVIGYDNEARVSVDYAGTDESVFIDGRWTRLMHGRRLRLVLWYDNEWGYSNRVVDLAALVGGGNG